MARLPRIKYEGAGYYVTSRGNDRQAVFFAERDYAKFTEYLAAAKEKYGCLVRAYVLMTNHYHLLIETPRPDLSQVMYFLNGLYTTYMNVKRRRSGHLFQGRFKVLFADRDVYLLELSRFSISILFEPGSLRGRRPIRSAAIEGSYQGWVTQSSRWA